MSFLRSLSATLLSAATTFSLVSASGCGTSAVGVDDCRDIQQARCRAGKSCGIVDDVPACERYYRDHCLHGLAATPPAGASVAACISVIDAAGRCAAADPENTLGDCGETVTESLSQGTSACEIIKHPERADECAFLTDVPQTDGGAGQNAGGAPGDSESGGTSGSGGTAGSAGETAGGSPAE